MSFQETLWKFLNSGLGLLVSSFFLTSLTGAFLTTWYKRESKKQEIRFLRLHEERAEAIKIFHDKTLEVDKEFSLLHLTGNILGFDKMLEVLAEFLALSDEYKIYFNKELCELIDEISSIFGFFGAYAMGQVTDIPFSEKDRARLTDYLNSLIESLRQEFRNILGVE